MRDTRISVERWGDEGGKPLFYWHGGGGGSEETALLAPPLVAAGYTLYALDAPGYGSSEPLAPDGYAQPSLAGLATDLLSDLGLSPAIWIGYSWGASVGLHTAARFPDSIRGLALLDGGYLVAEDDPDYNADTDYDDELEELRRRAAAGESWDAPHEVIGAAMVASRSAPCPPLYPLVQASGIPVLLAHGDRANAVVPEVLLDLGDQVEGSSPLLLRHLDAKRVVDGGEAPVKDGVDDDALDLDDLARVRVSHESPGRLPGSV